MSVSSLFLIPYTIDVQAVRCNFISSKHPYISYTGKLSLNDQKKLKVPQDLRGKSLHIRFASLEKAYSEFNFNEVIDDYQIQQELDRGFYTFRYWLGNNMGPYIANSSGYQQIMSVQRILAETYIRKLHKLPEEVYISVM